MDPIKDAFQKVKEDMNSLKEELDFIKKELAELKNKEVFNQNIEKNTPNISTQESDRQTDTKDIPTQNFNLEPLKDQNLSISSGNEGVPTDRQTDRQTNRQTNRQTDFRGDNIHDNNYEENFSFNPKRDFKEENKENKNHIINNKDHTINNAAEILDSLDSLKKEIRLKFKRLTDQEFLVFSTLYQIDQDLGYSSYKDISERLNLTESSIRDYIGRLINKGIPIEKNKINNKNIQLNISSNLKKIATLPTIIRLRDL